MSLLSLHSPEHFFSLEFHRNNFAHRCFDPSLNDFFANSKLFRLKNVKFFSTKLEDLNADGLQSSTYLPTYLVCHHFCPRLMAKGQCDQIRRKFATLAKFKKPWAIFHTFISHWGEPTLANLWHFTPCRYPTCSLTSATGPAKQKLFALKICATRQ